MERRREPSFDESFIVHWFLRSVVDGCRGQAADMIWSKHQKDGCMKRGVCFLITAACAFGATAPEILNHVARTYQGLQTYEFVVARTSDFSAGGMIRSEASHIALA